MLKTFLKFFINLSCNILIGGAFFAPPIFATAKEQPPTFKKFPGVIESLESLIEVDRVRFNKKMETIAKNAKIGLDLNKISSPALDPDFLQSIVFNSDKKVLSMMGENPCAIYALFETNLLKNSSGKITDVVIRYQGDKDMLFALVPKNEFAEKSYRNTCQDNIKLKQKYQSYKIGETFNSLPIKIPKLEAECPGILKDWRKNPEMPYLCDAIDTIGKGELAQADLMKLGGTNPRLRQDLLNQVQVANTFLRQIPAEKYTYFKNLCSNLGNDDLFCQSYFNLSYWNKALGSEGVKADLESRCQSILNKIVLTEIDYKSCVLKLNQNPELCHYEKSSFHNSLTPKPSCPNLSRALNMSRLYRDYNDCPISIGTEGIINTERVLFHVSDEYKKTFVVKGDDPTLCFTKATAAFSKLNLDFEQNEAWAPRACYEDKINAKEVCLPILMGYHPNSDYSEEKVILNILYKTKGAEKNTKCEVVSVNDYNPSLLKYRYGCYLIYDNANCSGVYCPKKIMFNDLAVNHITYKYGVNFDYFPNSIPKESYSITGLIENQIKISSARVTNVTTLRFYLNQSPSYVIHGIGCVEDILPSFFQKSTMNACTPITFIVDGILEKGGRASLIVRTAMDDLHSPRIIDWNYIFSAVKSFQEYHPLRIWGLYVLKK
ncbi:MAG: hypothetical protein ACOYL6_09640 [Bacteriovoracaceae bacterium]